MFAAIDFIVKLTEQIVLLPLYYDYLLISSNDFPRVCSPNNIIRTTAINENNDIANIKFKKPYGWSKTKKIGPKAPSPRLIPSTIPEAKERILVGKLSEVQASKQEISQALDANAMKPARTNPLQLSIKNPRKIKPMLIMLLAIAI